MCAATLDEVRNAIAEERRGVEDAMKVLMARRQSVDEQLRELISMRTSKLITDAEFVIERDRIRRQLRQHEGTSVSSLDSWLTDTDEQELVQAFEDVYGLWEATPTPFKRGFEELMFPAGYVFREIRTADRGLLFRVFASPTGGHSSWVAPDKPALNRLMEDISKFLAIIRASQGRHEPQREAA